MSNSGNSAGSAAADSPAESDTYSLESEYDKTVDLHGRKFQEGALGRGSLHTPVDEEEKERLEGLHLAYQRVFDGRLIFPPIPNPKRILDCGYGTASWTVAVAEQYPDAEVDGVDITPLLKPELTPPNLRLYVDDLNQPLSYPRNTFDLIRSQNVCTGIDKNRWPTYIQECAGALKPGGWLQFVEVYMNVQSDNGAITEHHGVRQLNDLFMEAMEANRDIRAPLKLHTWMRDAGLVEVDSRMIPLHLNGWSTDPEQRLRGEIFGELFKDGISGQVLIPLTQCLKMELNQVQVLVASSRRDLDDTQLKPYVGLYISIGRKPSA